MTSLTPTLGLILYNSTTDATASFLTFRTDLDGTAVSSNMYLIDSGILADRTRLTALEALKFIIPVSATFTSGSTYNATVAQISSYVNNSVIMITLDTTNAGTTLLQVNALATLELTKGNGTSLVANDLIAGRYYFFRYNLATTKWVEINSNSGDNLNVPGTVGNLATITTNGALLGTLTQSLMLSQTTHSATAKTTLISTDELPVVDTAASNVLKKVTYSDLLTGVGTNIGAQIAAATAKSTPTGSDLMVIADVAASNATKKVTLQQLTSQFGTYINSLTAKTTLAVGDALLLMDSGAANVSKQITMTNFWGAMGAFIAAFTSKGTPIAADSLPLSDSAASGAIKNVTLTNLFAQLGILTNAFTAKTTPALADVIPIGDSASSYAAKKSKVSDIFSVLNAPGGFMINGVINVTVASNNITLALKTLSGGNPSATDPVYIRINGVIRSVTSALSVTKNAGTNWFNSGSSELATNEIDYFAYLGYNSGTSAVVIGFARIPFATQYSDFSATTTNERYGAISDITTIAAGDYFHVIGRFAATLSATSAFNWSVPTFTALNLINYPIVSTRNLTWTPTIGYSGGTTNPTSNTPSAAIYYLNYNQFNAEIVSALVIGSGNRVVVTFSTPFTPPRITPISCIDTVTASSTKFPTYAFANTSGVFQLSETMQNNGSYYLNATLSL